MLPRINRLAPPGIAVLASHEACEELWDGKVYVILLYWLSINQPADY
jgi:hypothetical protein